jgi:hypothetical protein
MKNVSHLTAMILTSLLAAATPVAAKEDPLEKAPKAVQQVVRTYIDQSFGGGRVFRVLVVKRGKEKIYTVDLMGKNGKKKSLSLTPPGKILADVIRPAEKIIPLKEAPQGLRSTLEVLRGKRKVKTVAELEGFKSHGHNVYKITLTDEDGKESFYRISSPGKVLENPEE